MTATVHEIMDGSAVLVLRFTDEVNLNCVLGCFRSFLWPVAEERCRLLLDFELVILSSVL